MQTPKTKMTLNEMKPKDRCRVRKITARGPLGQRLMDMGFFPGVEIYVVRNAPLVDPVELRLGEYHVSVRHDEAGFVEVERE